jgi:hypothetical protein
MPTGCSTETPAQIVPSRYNGDGWRTPAEALSRDRFPIRAEARRVMTGLMAVVHTAAISPFLETGQRNPQGLTIH